MQEEVTQKTIAFSIKSAKLTIQVLQAAARKFLETQNKGKTKLHHGKLHHGQQSLKQLKKHGAALSNIEITDANIGLFKPCAKKYGVDFTLRKDAPSPALHCDFQGQGRRQHGTGVQGVHGQEVAAGGTALDPQGHCRKQGKGGGPQR